MTLNHYSNSDRSPGPVAKSIRDHWRFFFVEGVALILLGLLAIVVPLIANVYVTVVLGWLFLVSGAVGLATTSHRLRLGRTESISAVAGWRPQMAIPSDRHTSYWARQAPGFWCDLFATRTAPTKVASKADTRDPSVMFGIEHRRKFSGRWAWIFASGVIDIVLASIVLASIITFNLQGTSAWTMGLLVGINMILGGSALIAMGLHARTEHAGSNAIPLSNA